jgi:AraC-like DNA-binding protein
MQYEMPGGLAQLDAGTWFYVPPWRKRRWRATGDAELRIAWCTFALIPDLPLLPNLAYAPGGDPSRHQRLLSYFSPKEQRSAALQLRVEAFLKETIAWILLDGELLEEETMDDHSMEEALPFRPASSENIMGACQFLARNLDEPDALQKLPAISELSPGYFRGKFKEETGATPREYLNALRMHKAHSMLFSGRCSVKETAFSCGFTDQLYFSRAYHKFWGVAPSTVEETMG